MLGSKKFRDLVKSARKGQDVDVEIGGRLIQARPNSSYAFSGFTNFQRKGFTIGPDAFTSEAELKKTVLQELYRLKNQPAWKKWRYCSRSSTERNRKCI